MTTQPTIVHAAVNQERKRFCRWVTRWSTFMAGCILVVALDSSRAGEPLLQRKEEVLRGQAEIRQMVDTLLDRAAWGGLPQNYEYILCFVARKQGISSVQLRSFLNLCANQAMVDDSVPLKHKVRALREAGRLLDARDFAIESARRLEKENRKSRIEEVELWTEAAKSEIDLHQFVEALNYADKATCLADRTADFRAWSGARIQKALALDWLSRGSQALAVYKEVIPLQQVELGREHPETLSARIHRGISLSRLGKLSEAEKEYRVVRAICERTFGTEHPETLRARWLIASILDERQNSGGTERERRSILEAQVRVLGAEHLDTVASRDLWAHWLLARRRYGEAEQVFREVLKVREQVLGAQDSGQDANYSNLVHCLTRQGKTAEALEIVLRLESELQKNPAVSEESLFMLRDKRVYLEEEIRKNSATQPNSKE